MAAYSVADAKNRLPSLIDKAIAGEEVVITRHGKPVAELRASTKSVADAARVGSYAWLKARRDQRPSVSITSVELLDQMYEKPDI